MFQKAQRKKAKLRLAFCGPSGSGKTYSGLLVSKGLGGPVAVIDTERGSAELYSDLLDYDVCQLQPPFHPDKYIQAIKEAEREGYNVVVIDSLSHAWAGQGGLLEEVDKRKSNQKNQFSAWRDVTPLHNQLVDSMLQSSAHIIATMRTKVAYDMQKDEKGNLKPVKIGLSPVQREGMEYEFTAVLDLDVEKHIATASKDRTRLFDGRYFKPGEETGQELKAWLEQGIEAPQIQQPSKDQSQSSTFQEQHQASPDMNKLKEISANLDDLGYKSNPQKLQYVNDWLKNKGAFTVDSSKKLSPSQVDELIQHIQEQAKDKNDPKQEMDELPFN